MAQATVSNATKSAHRDFPSRHVKHHVGQSPLFPPRPRRPSRGSKWSRIISLAIMVMAGRGKFVPVGRFPLGPCVPLILPFLSMSNMSNARRSVFSVEDVPIGRRAAQNLCGHQPVSRRLRRHVEHLGRAFSARGLVKSDW